MIYRLLNILLHFKLKKNILCFSNYKKESQKLRNQAVDLKEEAFEILLFFPVFDGVKFKIVQRINAKIRFHE